MCHKTVPTENSIEMMTKEIHFGYVVDGPDATALARDK